MCSSFGGAGGILQENKIAKQSKERNLSICIGGVSKPEHAGKILARGADGVIVGSAIAAVIEANLKDAQTMVKRVRDFAAEMKEATRDA